MLSWEDVLEVVSHMQILMSRVPQLLELRVETSKFQWGQRGNAGRWPQIKNQETEEQWGWDICLQNFKTENPESVYVLWGIWPQNKIKDGEDCILWKKPHQNEIEDYKTRFVFCAKCSLKMNLKIAHCHQIAIEIESVGL